MDESGVKLEGLELQTDAIIQSGYKKPDSSLQPGWVERDGAY